MLKLKENNENDEITNNVCLQIIQRIKEELDDLTTILKDE